MKLRIAIIVGMISLCLPGAARAEDLSVAGKVVDAAGKPAADVELASFWSSRNNSMQAYQSTKSDASGRFSLKVQFYGQGLAVLALDKERKTGGLVSVDKESAGKDLSVNLGPLVRVKGDFFCKELDQK